MRWRRGTVRRHRASGHSASLAKAIRQAWGASNVMHGFYLTKRMQCLGSGLMHGRGGRRRVSWVGDVAHAWVHTPAAEAPSGLRTRIPAHCSSAWSLFELVFGCEGAMITGWLPNKCRDY